MHSPKFKSAARKRTVLLSAPRGKKIRKGKAALGIGAVCVFVCVGAATAFAQEAGASPKAVAPQAFPGDLFAPTRTTLLGDMAGLRPLMASHGITLGIQDFNEVFGNVSGGVKQGAVYDGLTIMTLGVDAQKALGLNGGTFNVSVLQIRGGNLSASNLDVLQTNSGITAQPTTRLWELWYQQTFLGGKASIKVGQQSIDNEFMTSQQSSVFINTVMGWPMLPSADLYAGGPAYPLSSLGARVQYQPTDKITVLAGAFADNPPGGPFDDDSQLRGSSAWGGNFLHLNTGALLIAELQYAINQPSTDKNAPPPLGLPGVYKIGAWFDTAGFPDQRFDTAGLSLANPASNGVPRTDWSNFSVYAVMDQMIWRPSADSAQALGVFARVMASPGDRNLIEFAVNGGVTLKAPLPGRDNDTLGLGFGVTHVGSSVTNVDQDTVFYSGGSMPIRTTESYIEATYQYQLAPWWQLQPDFQYFIRPGAGVPNPNNPTARLGDEAVFGLRSVVSF